MAVVVSDTSPLNYLVLTRPETPGPVRRWVERRPIWLEVVTPASPAGLDLSHLGVGEAQAITLALECRAEVLLLDERDGTATARARGWPLPAHWASWIAPPASGGRISQRCSPV